eukprot:358377-Chlamydomonas_euryale.AAC.2
MLGKPSLILYIDTDGPSNSTLVEWISSGEASSVMQASVAGVASVASVAGVASVSRADRLWNVTPFQPGRHAPKEYHARHSVG